jgi:hypothetical protein
MGNKADKPWSFGFFGGKAGNKSIIVCFLVVVFAVLTHIGGAFYDEMKDRRERPALALKSILRDVREYVRVEKTMPSSWREVEAKIWNVPSRAPSRLLGGILVVDNYEYFYHAGKVGEVSLVNIWALPLGKYRDQYETVLLVITAEGDEVWRGPALNEAQREMVLNAGFNPSFAQMSQLNMKKDAPAPASTPKRGSGLF